MSRKPIACLLLTALIFSALLLPGCRRSSGKESFAKAEAALEKVLNSWARGESPEKFADSNEAVQAVDPDWKAGYRLLGFLIAETQNGENPDQFRCRVALSQMDTQGQGRDRVVTYRVQLGKKVIIDRDSPP